MTRPVRSPSVLMTELEWLVGDLKSVLASAEDAGMTPEEIAVILRIKPRTLRSIMHSYRMESDELAG